MTTPRLPSRSAASQVRGITADYAWIVNFDNGNTNWNNQNNDYRVRAVRASESQTPSFRSLHAAMRKARQRKKPSPNQLSFDDQWIDRLIGLESSLLARTWEPLPTTCFVAKAPKAREIHAPEFADRVVHHWLVPHLERIYERTFIFDSYSNRAGKGTHAAVRRLRQFVRETGDGYFLQLDIKNFFNRISRPILYRMLKERMDRCGLSNECRHVVHALLKRSPVAYGVRYACTPAELALIPPHKRLDRAPSGFGIPIGNLSSQFFANVYLDRLDQFVKRHLGAKRYLRYVDDFVLLHRDRDQLVRWHIAIEQFLKDTLSLELKDGVKLEPLSRGIDFLGYIVFPTHTIVRRRVVGHCNAKIQDWQRRHVVGGEITKDPDALAALKSVCSSYAGHFSHASSYRLRQRIGKRFPWLRDALRGTSA